MITFCNLCFVSRTVWNSDGQCHHNWSSVGWWAGKKQLLWDSWLGCPINLITGSGIITVNNILINMLELSRRDEEDINKHFASIITSLSPLIVPFASITWTSWILALLISSKMFLILVLAPSVSVLLKATIKGVLRGIKYRCDWGPFRKPGRNSDSSLTGKEVQNICLCQRMELHFRYFSVM